MINHDQIDDRISNYFKGGELFIELGCGAGFVLDELSERYQYSIGFDVSNRRLLDRKEKPNWDFQICDLNMGIPLEAASVDAIYANQVIEHIINPIEFVSEIKRVLKPDGVAVMTTPNIRYIKNIIKLIFSGYGPRTANNNIIDGAWDDGHLHYFTHSDLKLLCKANDLTNCKTSALVGDYKSNAFREILNKLADTYIVREFLTGNIIYVITK